MHHLDIIANRAPFSLDGKFITSLEEHFYEKKNSLVSPSFGQGGLASAMTGLLKPRDDPYVRDWKTTWFSSLTSPIESRALQGKYDRLFQFIKDNYSSKAFPHITVRGEDDDAFINMKYMNYDFDMQFVSMGKLAYMGFYDVTSNGLLWPLLHSASESLFESGVDFPRPTFSNWMFNQYKAVNDAFAAAIVDNASKIVAKEGSSYVAWVQDYHLLLVPEAMRAIIGDLHVPKAENIKIGQFIHTPFFDYDVVKPLFDDQSQGVPTGSRPITVKDLLADLTIGMLGNDAVSFHVPRYAENFVHAVDEFTNDRKIRPLGDGAYLIKGRKIKGDGYTNDTLVSVNPIGVDVQTILKESHPAGQFHYALNGDRNLEDLLAQNKQAGIINFGGMERLDYTKGLLERFDIYKELQRLGMKGQFFQISAPSRQNNDAYKNIARLVNDKVARVNHAVGMLKGSSGKTPAEASPIMHVDKGMSRPNNYRFMRETDVMMVTTKEDGMNLVVYESILAKAALAPKDRGLIVVGRCGAQDVLSSYSFDERDGVVFVDPTKPKDAAQKIYASWQQGYRVSDRLIDKVKTFEVNKWADACLDNIVSSKYVV